MRLAITGGSGFLALNWAAVVSGRYETHLLLHQRPLSVPFANTVFASLSSKEAAHDTLKSLQPDIVVHTAALSNVELCENEPAQAHAVNALMPANVAAACQHLGCRMVQVSTDHLFAGDTPLLNEKAIPSPVNVYAKTKAEGERLVLEANPDALVLRTNFYGFGPQYRSAFADFILNGLRTNEAIGLFSDVFYTPIFVGDLIERAHALLDMGSKGIFNVVGPERLSKHAFGIKLARAFGLNSDKISRTCLSERLDLTPRPLDMSLDGQQVDQLLGMPSRSPDEALFEMAKLEKTSVVKGLKPLMIPYGRHKLDDADRTAVAEFLAKDGWLTQGPTVAAFEAAVAKRVGASYAVAVSSGTAGLHVAALAADLGAGRKLLTSPVSFVASANAARYCGAQVCFADIDPSTANLNIAACLEKLNEDEAITAVMPIHFSGHACDMEMLAQGCSRIERRVVVIEDAAHAFGGQYACGAEIGSCKYSDMTVFSFHPVKSIAMGEGGLVTTNDEQFYRRLLRLRSHGINKLDDELLYPSEAGPWYYEMQELGFNYRITDLQCALGLSQLSKLDKFIKRRRALASRYDASFSQHDFVRPAQSIDTSRSAHHLYVVRIDFQKTKLNRSELMLALKERGIVSQVHYVPIPMQPYYRDLGHDIHDFPNSHAYYSSCLSIPLFFSLTDSQQAYVIETMNEFLD